MYALALQSQVTVPTQGSTTSPASTAVSVSNDSNTVEVFVFLHTKIIKEYSISYKRQLFVLNSWSVSECKCEVGRGPVVQGV